MPDNRPPSVEVSGLAKRYGQIEAVRGVSFGAARGEIFGLLGRNGAGKTTTLECVLGLRRPDDGRVIIDGVDGLAEPEQARARVGAQLQAAALQEKITPREALRFFGSFYRNADSADALLARFGLQSKADAPFESLSGGQKQRLFLALAFVHRPVVVVLDEPTAGLDPQARHELHDVIRQAAGTGVTIVLSTHDLTEAQQLCHRVGILHEGKLIAVGTPGELLARSGARARIAFRTSRLLSGDELHAIAQRASATVVGREPVATLECADINTAIMALAQQLAATGNGLVDVQIQPPSLEQLFLELTGRAWDEREGDA